MSSSNQTREQDFQGITINTGASAQERRATPTASSGETIGDSPIVMAHLLGTVAKARRAKSPAAPTEKMPETTKGVEDSSGATTSQSFGSHQEDETDKIIGLYEYQERSSS